MKFVSHDYFLPTDVQQSISPRGLRGAFLRRKEQLSDSQLTECGDTVGRKGSVAALTIGTNAFPAISQARPQISGGNSAALCPVTSCTHASRL